MNIVRGTVQEWTSLDKIRTVFERKKFDDIEEDDEGLTVAIVDNEELGKEFLKIIEITEDYSRYYRYLEGAGGAGISYLLLIKDFEEFVFVREIITTLGKKRIEKFTFYRSDLKRSSLEKLNNLEFNNLESFENLFDKKAVVNEFYEKYKENRDKLVSKIQGIKEKEDKERYAQVIFDRLIFLQFIQEKGFLLGDKHFLINKYEQIKKEKKNYFEDFLKFLFFDVLNMPLDRRSLKNANYNDIPFLNGGLFREHRIELENPKIWVSNDIIKEIIFFLGDWYWYVEESSDFGEDKALSPEILGHIFEKTITGQKGKGAFYTPDAMTNYVAENTIYPYLLQKVNQEFNVKYASISSLIYKAEHKILEHTYFKILKNIKILDNAVGSGAFLLAAQKILVETYLALWEKLKDSDSNKVIEERNILDNHISASHYYRKYVISRNLFGVDIEEGAIEICKLRLWLSLVSDLDPTNVEPLPNIDYQILCGNSLVGLIYPPNEEQVKFEDIRSIKQILKEINELKNTFANIDDPEKTKKLKEKIDQKIRNEDTVLRKKLLNIFHSHKILITEDELAKLNPFNWSLHFSGTFSDENKHNNGFDIIIGNPPWEIFKPVEKEFFSNYDSKLTKYGIDKIEAKKVIRKLKEDKNILQAWNFYEHGFKIEGDYYKKSEDYKWQSGEINGRQISGDLNLYKLFLERSYHLLKKDGFCGMITPSGFYTDAGTKGLRRLLFDNSSVKHMYCFENRKGIFDSIHRSFKFIILIYQKDKLTEEFSSGFMWHDVALLKNVDKHSLKIKWEWIKKLSPSSLSILELKNLTDLEIVKKMYRYPVLYEKINDCRLALYRELDMTLDSDLFESNKGGLILYEGKMIEQYESEFSKERYYISPSKILNKFGNDYCEFKEHRLAFRAVASSTNRRSMIATILPKNVFAGNSLIVSKIFEEGVRIIDLKTLLYLCGVFNSKIMDYLLRLKITTNLNMFFIYELPVPRLKQNDERFQKIINRVARLVCSSSKFMEISKQESVPILKLADKERAEIIEQIEDTIRQIFDLSQEQHDYIKTQFKNLS